MQILTGQSTDQVATAEVTGDGEANKYDEARAGRLNTQRSDGQTDGRRSEKSITDRERKREMNTCQHCGIELTNARAKNCKTCSGLLTEANRKNAYGFVMEAISAAKAEGVAGEAMHKVITAAMSAGISARNAWINENRAFWKQYHAEKKDYLAAEERPEDNTVTKPGIVTISDVEQ